MRNDAVKWGSVLASAVTIVLTTLLILMVQDVSVKLGVLTERTATTQSVVAARKTKIADIERRLYKVEEAHRSILGDINVTARKDR